jgi:hypothetical protein
MQLRVYTSLAIFAATAMAASATTSAAAASTSAVDLTAGVPQCGVSFTSPSTFSSHMQLTNINRSPASTPPSPPRAAPPPTPSASAQPAPKPSKPPEPPACSRTLIARPPTSRPSPGWQRRAARLFSPALALMCLLLLRRLFLLLDLLPRLLLLLVVLCSSVLALWLLVLVLLLLSCKVHEGFEFFWWKRKWDKQHTGCILVWGERVVNTKTSSPFQRYQKGIAALLLYHSRARFCIVEE